MMDRIEGKLGCYPGLGVSDQSEVRKNSASVREKLTRGGENEQVDKIEPSP